MICALVVISRVYTSCIHLVIKNVTKSLYLIYIYNISEEQTMKLNLKTLDEKTENTNVNLYLSTKDKLKTLAINNGISVSNVIRSAINDMLDKEGK